jgi:hypothetical protein
MFAAAARDDASILFTVPDPVPVGVWEPPETGMLAPWLGFVTPLVLDRPVRLNGPHRLRSKAYADEFRQVKRVGRVDSTARTAEQTSMAIFFNTSSLGMQREALIQRLEPHPLPIRRTARMFPGMDAAHADRDDAHGRGRDEALPAADGHTPWGAPVRRGEPGPDPRSARRHETTSAS